MKRSTIIATLFFVAVCIVRAQEFEEFKFTAQPENLGQNVNTAYSDFKPIVSPDGNTVYFIRRDYPGNMGGTGKDDIWYSQYINGSWTVAQNMQSPLNNAGINAVASIMPDGNSMLLMSVYNYFDGSMSNGVSMSYRDKKGWLFPKKQTIDDWLNLNDNVGYYLTNDGQVLITAAERKKKECFGELDLYVSKRTGENEWSTPVNMGATLNTAGDEYGMFLAADGKTLFFASDGHGGYGDVDIWMSKRLDDTWTNWSKPVNLGPPINTEGWDAYFTIPASGEYAYFSSDKNSFGKTDLFRIKMPSEAKPDPVMLVKGKVLDKETNEPVKADIYYEILPGGKEAGQARSEPNEGKYNIVLPKGYKYGFNAKAKGYYAISENLDLKELEEYEEIERDIYLAPIKVGEVVRLNNIFFEFGKATLIDESFPELDRVVKLMEENPNMTLEISGHTDNVGSDEANMTLSSNRAEAVVEYLKEKGVKKNRLSFKGYGETAPVATNDTEEGRQLNRRVEFKILNK